MIVRAARSCQEQTCVTPENLFCSDQTGRNFGKRFLDVLVHIRSLLRTEIWEKNPVSGNQGTAGLRAFRGPIQTERQVECFFNDHVIIEPLSL